MKRLLNISTVEAWLLDRLEGRLSPEEERQLSLFLDQHPEIDSDIDELPVLQGESLSMNHASLLKSIEPVGKINESNYEDRTIASIEGLSTRSEEEALERFYAKNPALHAERLYFDATKLTVDTSIQYPNKEQLKKSRRIIPISIGSAAASVAIILGAFFYLNSEEDVIHIEPIAANSVEVARDNEPKELAISTVGEETQTSVVPQTNVEASSNTSTTPQPRPKIDDAPSLEPIYVANISPELYHESNLNYNENNLQYIDNSLAKKEKISAWDRLRMKGESTSELFTTFNAMVSESQSQVKSEFDRRLNITRDSDNEVRSWSVQVGPLGLSRSRNQK